LAKIDHHAEAVEELEGILAFAERILPRASDLWVQASLETTRNAPTVASVRDSEARKVY